MKTTGPQQLFAQYGFRPVVPKVLEANRAKYPSAPRDLHDRRPEAVRRLARGRQEWFDRTRPDGRRSRRGSEGPLASTARRPPSRCAAAAASEREGRDGPLARLRLSFLSVVVVLPIAALVWGAGGTGRAGFWDAVSSPEAVAALKLSLGAAVVVSLVNAVLGTITAWVLVRDDFRGKALVNAVIDLPFALPTIVAGLTLLALYGPKSPVGDQRRVHARRDRARAALRDAPVRRPHGAAGPASSSTRRWRRPARSLGASDLAVFRRIVLPNILPGILSRRRARFRTRASARSARSSSSRGTSPTRRGRVGLRLPRIQSGDATGAAAVAVVLLDDLVRRAAPDRRRPLARDEA